jgi:ParB family chromosome partitioning protein
MARKIFDSLKEGAATDGTTVSIASKLPAMAALKAATSVEKLIDPDIIDDWGPADRLTKADLTAVKFEDENGDLTAVKSSDHLIDNEIAELAESIRQQGQSSPIEVRESPEHKGRYQVIAGRRRLAACRALGFQVNAVIKHMTDEQALLRKGLENSNRRARSFYEDAFFARSMIEAGHDRAFAADALGGKSHASMSQLMRVANNIPFSVAGLIGPAPKSGRPKWDDLASAFIEKRISEDTAVQSLHEMHHLASDQRLEKLLASLAEKNQKAKRTAPHGATITEGQGALSISIKRKGENTKFADWFNGNFDRLIEQAHHEFLAEQNKQEE